MSNSSPNDKNRRSSIKTEQWGSSAVCTYTSGRDPGSIEVKVVSYNDAATEFQIFNDKKINVNLNGREARTGYETLKKHFKATGRSA